MTSSEKKVVFTLIAIFVAILLIVVIVKNVGNKTPDTSVTNNEETANTEKYVTQLENDVKINNSENVNSVKKFKNLEISNVQFTSQNGSSVLLADVKNTGSTTHEKEIVTITILGDNNTVIATLDTILTTIEPGETKQLNVIATADIVNAKDFTITEK